jgi:hypothetical protein
MTPWAFVDLDKFIVFGFRGSVFTCSLQIRSEKFQSFFKKIIQSQIAQTAGMAASARLTAVKSRSPSRNGTKGR